MVSCLRLWLEGQQRLGRDHDRDVQRVRGIGTQLVTLAGTRGDGPVRPHWPASQWVIADSVILHGHWSQLCTHVGNGIAVALAVGVSLAIGLAVDVGLTIGLGISDRGAYRSADEPWRR